MSRFHCEFVIGEGAPVIRDLGSRNGTQVGDTSVRLGHLRDGSMLALGRTRVRFELTSHHVRHYRDTTKASGLRRQHSDRLWPTLSASPTPGPPRKRVRTS